MNQLATMLNQLKALAAEADEQRLLVFADDFEREFPQYAADVQQIMQSTPEAAINYLVDRHVSFVVLKLIPDAPQWIGVLQRAYALRASREGELRDYMRAHPPDALAVRGAP